MAVQYHGLAVSDQKAVEDHGPDVAQHDAADQVRHEEHRPEQIGALDAPRQRIGHREGQRVDEQHRHKGKQRREQEGMAEAAVGKGLQIVVKAYPCPLAGQLEFAEGQERALQERVDEPDAEGGKGGQQKQPHHALNWPSDQSAVQRSRVPFRLKSFH